MEIKDFLAGKNYANKDAKINIEEALISYFSDAVLNKVNANNNVSLRQQLYGTAPLDPNTKTALEEKLKNEYSINIEDLSRSISKIFKAKNGTVRLQKAIGETKDSIEKCVEILLGKNNNINKCNSSEESFIKELVDNQIKPMIEKKAKTGFYLKQFYTKFFYYMYSERKK